MGGIARGKIEPDWSADEGRKGGRSGCGKERPRKAKRITVGGVVEIKREIAQEMKTDREGDVRLEQFLGKPRKKKKRQKSVVGGGGKASKEFTEIPRGSRNLARNESFD
jgi:hypothetical protein